MVVLLLRIMRQNLMIDEASNAEEASPDLSRTEETRGE